MLERKNVFPIHIKKTIHSAKKSNSEYVQTIIKDFLQIYAWDLP